MNIIINLLPEVYQNHLKEKFYRRLIFSGAVVATIVMATINLALSSLFISSKLELDNAKENISAKQEIISQNQDLINQTTTLQHNLDAAYQLDLNRAHHSKLVDKIFNILPSGIRPASIKIKDDLEISIVGRANSTEEVADKLVGNLRDAKDSNSGEDLFTDIKTESVSSSTGSSQVGFEIVFTANPVILQVQEEVVGGS
ncbi:hypothetical protein KC853_01185 [Candidatus Saccharibacteria bacterium]|nr:hypothetical protein [Candidatus Saccharibacteria bacterium]MCB9834659.1 hypothetical protein [Candidatus Nomurabacteria bacterium]